VSTWRKVAAKFGVTAAEIGRMASAFEHEDSKAVVADKAVSQRKSRP
jgi:hypothetical protein